MNYFETIGKRLPYRESNQYVDRLTEQAVECAINRQQAAPSSARPRRWRYFAAAAVVTLLLAGTGVTYMATRTSPTATLQPADAPLDHFLNTISDDDAMLLTYYDVDEYPDYYE